jgi:hypothetical protein
VEVEAVSVGTAVVLEVEIVATAGVPALGNRTRTAAIEVIFERGQ